jgi:polar amino acid transport system substrate-binding protein
MSLDLFMSLDARAAGDLSPPVFQFDFTLLVPAGSAIRGVADADRLGVRIAAIRNHSSTNELSRLLKQAQIVYADTPDPTFDLLRTGQAAAMASARPMLLDYSDKLRGSRVLEARYGANINRIVVAKGKAGWLAYISEFRRGSQGVGSRAEGHRPRRRARGHGVRAGRRGRPRRSRDHKDRS